MTVAPAERRAAEAARSAMEPLIFDRGAFLKGTAALVVAVGAPSLLDPVSARAAVSEFPIGPASISPTQIDSWLAIGADGTVTLKTGKVELGQGIVTTLRQLIADELDVALANVKATQGDTWITVDQSYTAGSQSTGTQFGNAGLRQAAAEARLALLNMASAQLGAPVSDLTVSNGVVSVKSNPSRQVSYAALIGGKTFNLQETGHAVPKPFTDYKILGTSVKRDDIPLKVFGSFTYVQDIRLPGMLHGRVVRPPTLDSTLKSVNGFGGSDPDGLVETFVRDNYVAVVSTTEEGAIIAAKTLKVDWNVAPLPNLSTYFDDLTTTTPAQNQVIQDSKVSNGKDVDATIAAASKKVTATYKYPLQLHGSMGTSASTAWVQGNTATVWSATQGVYQLRGALALALNLPAQNIHVIFVEGSGCYGLNKADDAAVDAAVLSQALGKPVRMAYMRPDEHMWENYGQPYTITITGALDTSGAKPRISAWKRDAWTASRGGRPGPPANMASGILMGLPETPFTGSNITTPSQALNSVDGSNSAPSYVIPAAKLTNHTVKRAFLTGPLRSPARIQNTFANETMTDELAYLAGADPVAFRLDHLQDPRLIQVIEAAANLAHWTYRPRASKIGTGRFLTGYGFSAMWYEGALGRNAAAVSVTVDTKSGKVIVNHVWSAQDCGAVTNPDGMRQQAEGCVMQGLSRSLLEELLWKSDSILSRDWVTYPVARFQAMPKFSFKVIDRKDQPPVGAGEVLITNMPAAIGNAIFDATGARLRQVPFTPARVRFALAHK